MLSTNPRHYCKVVKLIPDHPDPIEIVFIIDTPHIIKRLRNAFYRSGNSSVSHEKILKKNNLEIKWLHIRKIFEYDSQQCRINITRLRKDHLFLNPRSTMNTKLATQIFNQRNLNLLKELNLADSGTFVSFSSKYD